MITIYATRVNGFCELRILDYLNIYSPLGSTIKSFVDLLIVQFKLIFLLVMLSEADQKANNDINVIKNHQFIFLGFFLG